MSAATTDYAHLEHIDNVDDEYRHVAKEIIPAVGLNQCDAVEQTRIHPIIEAEAMLIHLTLIDMPYEESRQLLSGSERRIHLSRVALQSLAILQQVVFIGARHLHIQDAVGAGDG